MYEVLLHVQSQQPVAAAWWRTCSLATADAPQEWRRTPYCLGLCLAVPTTSPIGQHWLASTCMAFHLSLTSQTFSRPRRTEAVPAGRMRCLDRLQSGACQWSTASFHWRKEVELHKHTTLPTCGVAYLASK